MRVLVLHSDVGADAPPDDLDTLTYGRRDRRTPCGRGPRSRALAPFAASPEAIRDARRSRADARLQHGRKRVRARTALQRLAPSIFERFGVPYTGSGARPIALTGDKPLAKRLMRAAGLPTPDWASRRLGRLSTKARPTSSNRPPRTHRSASTTARWRSGKPVHRAR